jgi:hypothetical protein
MEHPGTDCYPTKVKARKKPSLTRRPGFPVLRGLSFDQPRVRERIMKLS